MIDGYIIDGFGPDGIAKTVLNLSKSKRKFKLASFIIMLLQFNRRIFFYYLFYLQKYLNVITTHTKYYNILTTSWCRAFKFNQFNNCRMAKEI
jgi:hypothetical protein